MHRKMQRKSPQLLKYKFARKSDETKSWCIFLGNVFCWNVSYTCIFCFNDRTGFWSIRLFVWIKRAVMLLVECGNQKICVHKGMHDNRSPKKTSKNSARDSLKFWSFDQLTNIYRYDLKFYQQFKLDLCKFSAVKKKSYNFIKVYYCICAKII